MNQNCDCGTQHPGSVCPKKDTARFLSSDPVYRLKDVRVRELEDALRFIHKVVGDKPCGKNVCTGCQADLSSVRTTVRGALRLGEPGGMVLDQISASDWTHAAARNARSPRELRMMALALEIAQGTGSPRLDAQDYDLARAVARKIAGWAPQVPAEPPVGGLVPA